MGVDTLIKRIENKSERTKIHIKLIVVVTAVFKIYVDN